MRVSNGSRYTLDLALPELRTSYELWHLSRARPDVAWASEDAWQEAEHRCSEARDTSGAVGAFATGRHGHLVADGWTVHNLHLVAFDAAVSMFGAEWVLHALHSHATDPAAELPALPEPSLPSASPRDVLASMLLYSSPAPMISTP